LVLWQNLDRLKMGEINFEHALGKRITATLKDVFLGGGHICLNPV
jgi:hypothetical protein